MHAVLANFPAPWLLIFENASDKDSVAPFLPPAGPGRVLITSENPGWPGQMLDVAALDLEAAAGRFLISRTGDPDRHAAEDLAGTLVGLPLALERAAAYIQASGDSLAGPDPALFRRRRAGMSPAVHRPGHKKTVATVWTLAFEELARNAEPGAVGLLRLLAYCAPEAIPVHLLLQPRAGLGDQLGPDVYAVAGTAAGGRTRSQGRHRRAASLLAHHRGGDGLVSVHRRASGRHR